MNTKMVRIGSKYFAPESLNFDRSRNLRQSITIRFSTPVSRLVNHDDGSSSEEVMLEQQEIFFPGAGDVEAAQQQFKAAYPVSKIVEIVHRFEIKEQE